MRGPQATGMVLVLGTYRAALTVVRALARRGRRVVVGRDPDRRYSEGSGGVEASRYTGEVWDHPSINRQPGAFLDALVAELDRRAEPVHVLPLDQRTVRLLAGERSRLPPHASLAVPATETIVTCMDKLACLEAAQAAGLPVPEWTVVGDYEELVAAVGRAPVVVKPLWPQERLPSDRKAIRCRDGGGLGREIPRWPADHDRLMVQRLVDGPRHNLDFAARDGELLDVVEVMCDRTDRLDGTGLAVAGRTRPVTTELRDQLAALVAHLRYTGVGCAQFIVQPGLAGAFLELNPRISGNCMITDRAGLDMANLAVDLAADLPTEPSALTPSIVEPFTWAWTFGDICGVR